MKNLFGKKEPDPVFEVEKPSDVLVAEIHETFFTEVDRLLEQANNLESTKSDKTDLIKKAERLRNLGFANAKTVSSVKSEERRIEEAIEVNEQKKVLNDAILYFSVKYPLYKFITAESVKKICQKYGLIFGPVRNYIGEVPEKNLALIESFSIKVEDKGYDAARDYSDSYEFVSHKRYKQYTKASYDDEVFSECEEASLEIAAPLKDFNTDNMNLVGFELKRIREVLDPVVLQPVHYGNGLKGYLIVTAWGDEASDPDVVNEKMN